MEEKRDTVGKISLELLEKSDDFKHSPTDQMQEQLTDYEKHIDECIARSKKDFDGDFYIVVITKKERLMQNVIRNFFTGRQSCPTPEWDQTVYRYNRKAGVLEFLWVIPAKDICDLLIANSLDLPKEQRALLKYVFEFSDGTLLRLAKKLNGEEDDSPCLVKG